MSSPEIGQKPSVVIGLVPLIQSSVFVVIAAYIPNYNKS